MTFTARIEHVQYVQIYKAMLQNGSSLLLFLNIIMIYKAK